MTSTAMMDIINKHNDMVHFIDTLEDVKIPADALLRLMPLASKMATLGLAVTHEAREMGIDAKCNMQSGEIIVYK
jgi:hypothetical protein